MIVKDYIKWDETSSYYINSKRNFYGDFAKLKFSEIKGRTFYIFTVTIDLFHYITNLPQIQYVSAVASYRKRLCVKQSLFISLFVLTV